MDCGRRGEGYNCSRPGEISSLLLDDPKKPPSFYVCLVKRGKENSNKKVLFSPYFLAGGGYTPCEGVGLWFSSVSEFWHMVGEGDSRTSVVSSLPPCSQVK